MQIYRGLVLKKVMPWTSMYQLSRPATATQINPCLTSFAVRLFNANKKLIRNGKNDVHRTHGLRTQDSWTTYTGLMDYVHRTHGLRTQDSWTMYTGLMDYVHRTHGLRTQDSWTTYT